jgi:hypothetical protein
MARRRITPGEVRVRQLVDDQDGRPAAQGRVDVEFLAYDAAVPHGQGRQPLEAFHEPLGFHPAVRLDVADHDVPAGGLRDARRLQHGVGLADARGGAEEDAQPPAPGAGLLGSDPGEQFVRIRARVSHASA